MEGLEIIVMVVGHLLTIIFDPFIFAFKSAKKWYNRIDPGNLPETLNFDDIEDTKFGVK